MKPLKILLVEDDLVLALNLEEILIGFGYEVTETASNFTEAIQIFTKEGPDLVLLDIDLGENSESGIEVGKVLSKLSNIPLIFISGNYEKTLRELAYEVRHSDFLVKPYNAAQIELTLERTFREYNIRQVLLKKDFKKILFVRGMKGFIRLDIEEIIYLEASGNSSYVFTSGNKQHVSTPLVDLLEQFNHKNILRIHRSFGVNLEKIVGFQENKVFVKINEQELGISLGRTYKEAFLERIHKIRSS